MASSEKEFYLQSFRERSVVIHLARSYRAAEIRGVVDELAANRTVVVVVAGGLDARTRTSVASRALLDPDSRQLVELAVTLAEGGPAWLARSRARDARWALELACGLATRLGAHKMVVVDPRGGLATTRGPRSFVNAGAALRVASSGQTSAGSKPWSKREVAMLTETVRSGVESVNLTTADGLADELFTYEGSGTLITLGDYCRVEPLRVDDFAQAVALLDRGEREGFLLPRSPEERARLLLHGYGAWFEGRLAGIASLETKRYARDKAAEVVGLYTITRFKGEGVGARILEELCVVAAARGCRTLFACTSNARAAEFFERRGFDRVGADQVPAAKWKWRGSRSSRRDGEPAALLRRL